MSVINITNESFENEVLRADKPVLLDFWASWCGPCRMVSPIVDEIAEERSDIVVGKINVNEKHSGRHEGRQGRKPRRGRTLQGSDTRAALIGGKGHGIFRFSARCGYKRGR